MIDTSGSASGCKNHKVIGAVDYAADASYADRVVLITFGPGLWDFLADPSLAAYHRCHVMSMKKNWPELVALTSFFSVELPGIEPVSGCGSLSRT